MRLEPGHLTERKLSTRRPLIDPVGHRCGGELCPTAVFLARAAASVASPRASARGRQSLTDAAQPLDPTWHVTSLPAKFVFLSYRNSATGLHLKGPDDFYFVVCWIFVWLAARVLSMRAVFEPLARRLQITDPKETVRFAEQGWSLA